MGTIPKWVSYPISFSSRYPTTPAAAFNPKALPPVRSRAFIELILRAGLRSASSLDPGAEPEI